MSLLMSWIPFVYESVMDWIPFALVTGFRNSVTTWGELLKLLLSYDFTEVVKKSIERGFAYILLEHRYFEGVLTLVLCFFAMLIYINYLNSFLLVAEVLVMGNFPF